MHDRRRRWALAGLLAAASAGCEDQGYGLRVAVSVSAEAVGRTSEAAPGLLVLEIATAELGTERRVYGVLCGGEAPVAWEVVLEGRSPAGRTELRAWIDADVLGLGCGPLSVDTPVDALTADAGEPQASAQAFEREGCGPAEEAVELELS